MNRYLLEISYIGTRFRGIQKTVNKLEEARLDTTTIQGCIELALRVFRPVNEIQTVLSSRTDAGVHALHSTLHVDLQRYDGNPYIVTTMIGVMNRTLDKQGLPIRVLNARIVPSNFHCRYNALGRTYLYRMAVAKESSAEADCLRNRSFETYLPVEELDRCFFLQKKSFDIERMREASRMLLGRHDFRTFMSTNGQKKPSSHNHPMFTVRSIHEINIKPGKTAAIGPNAKLAEENYNYWDIEIKGKSFLYKQVRRIVGALVAVASNRVNEKCLYEMLTIPSKNSWDHRILLAPAYGLYLCRVHYNENDFQLEEKPIQINNNNIKKMSLLEELKLKRNKLKACDTVITTATGERYLEKFSAHKIEKLNTSHTCGYVVDTKPDLKPAQILSNFLYLGSQDAVTMDNIKKYQLTHILSIGIECPLQNLPANLRLLHVACLDLPETSLKQEDIFAKSFEFIEMARSSTGRVLIHCNAGVSRSASIVIGYLMQYNSMDFEQAYKHVKTQRECIQPNAGFLKQLKEFRN